MKRKFLTGQTAIAVVFFLGWLAPAIVQASDGYIKQKKNRWVMGTGLVEKTVALKDGRFFLKSFVDKVTGSELVGANSGEFFVTLGDNDEPVTGLSGGWKLVDSKISELKQGEKQLSLTLQCDHLQVTKNYIVFPLTSVIREWVVFKNVGEEPLNICDPGFLDFCVQPGDPEDVEFQWMSGGASVPGSWELRTEQLQEGKPRVFDSYDSFPFPDDIMDRVEGDGTRARILLNDKQIWPEEGWAIAPHSAYSEKIDFNLDVEAGDKLVFLLNCNGNTKMDRTVYPPTIRYPDGKEYLSWGHFSGEQGKNGWSYQYMKDGQLKDMYYHPGPEENKDYRNGLWTIDKDDPKALPNIEWNWATPGEDADSARVCIVEVAGKVRVQSQLCDDENWAGGGHYGPKGGTDAYAPWYSFFNRKNQEGLFIGWDYFGHWKSQFTQGKNGQVNVRLKVMNFNKALAPKESVETPKAFAGLYQGGLDEAGNACLDWQYRYLWDYTRDGWFPAIRMIGRWTYGFGSQGKDIDSMYRQVFRVIDLMRYCGGDVYHRDYGWWDRLGDWNGPDWRSINNYLGKHDMGLLLYGTVNYAHRDSKVGLEVPDGYPTGSDTGYWMDCGKTQTAEAVKRVLDRWYDQWGPFTWRNDGGFIHPIENGKDDTPTLYQDQGFRDIVKNFLDKHPDCAFQSVNAGGTCVGYEYTQYSSTTSFTDGHVGDLKNYYASLMLPPDKTSDFPEKAQVHGFDKSTWRGKLCFNVDISQDSAKLSDAEGTRQVIDIYHYLHKNGVVGRWIKVYRPKVVGDDPTMYFQRLSADRKRGLILPKHQAPGKVTVFPKGLIADMNYNVSFQESQESQDRSGKDLMANGITIDQMLAGELIYLNLPLHPGSKLDTIAPTISNEITLGTAYTTVANEITKRAAYNMGFPGVEISWNTGSDNNWISYYEIARNGQVINKIAKGTFYFDHSAGADPGAEYEVRTVDGAGNVSAWASAQGPKIKPAIVLDDTDERIQYKGVWEHQDGVDYAFNKTLSRANQRGDTIQFTFEGKKIRWFARMGNHCGQALVNVGHPDSKGDASLFGESGYVNAEIVDTYSADDVWDVCVYEKELPEYGRYNIEIMVLDEQGYNVTNPEFWNPSGTSEKNWIYIDGLRVE